MQSGEMNASVKTQIAMTLQHFNEEDFSRLSDSKAPEAGRLELVHRRQVNEFLNFKENYSRRAKWLTQRNVHIPHVRARFRREPSTAARNAKRWKKRRISIAPAGIPAAAVEPRNTGARLCFLPVRQGSPTK
jgi:hypothetical protein